jgi:hypothetical protein
MEEINQAIDSFELVSYAIKLFLLAGVFCFWDRIVQRYKTLSDFSGKRIHFCSMLFIVMSVMQLTLVS